MVARAKQLANSAFSAALREIKEFREDLSPLPHRANAREALVAATEASFTKPSRLRDWGWVSHYSIASELMRLSLKSFFTSRLRAGSGRKTILWPRIMSAGLNSSLVRISSG